MSKLKKIIKTLLVFVMALMLTFTTLTVNTKTESAGNDTDGYDIEIYHGYGRQVTSGYTLSVLNGSDGAYKFTAKTSAGGYTANGPSSGATNRYDQAPQGEIASVDVYYGNQMLTTNSVTSSGTHCIKSYFYLNSAGELCKTNDGTTTWPSDVATRIVSFAAAKSGNTNPMASRWWNVPGDVKLVLHYTNEHTIAVNGVNDTLISEEYDTYFSTKDTSNNSTSTIISNNYSDTNGLIQSFEPLTENPLANASVGIGSNNVSTENASGVHYLSSSYTFSDTHASGDILAIDFDNNQIIYYVVNNDISVNFVYATDVSYDVTFMVNNEQYGEVQTVGEGITASRPSDPEIPEGYNRFVGWYLENSDEEFSFNTPITSNTTLYARFGNSYSFTFNNVLASSSSTWVANAGGATFAGENGTYSAYSDRIYETEAEANSNGFAISFDYNTAIENAAFTFGDVVANLEGSYFTSDVDTNKFLDSEGNWHDELEDVENIEYILKVSRAANQSVKNRMFIRLWNLKQDITVDVAITDRVVTFTNFGRNYTSPSGTFMLGNYVSFGTNGATWTAQTGGTLYASPKAAIDYFDGEYEAGSGIYPGAHHQAAAITVGDYHSDATKTGTGVGGTLQTELEHLESIIFTYGEKEPIVLEKPENGWNGLEIFIDKDYKIRFDTVAQDGDLFKMAISSTTVNTINIRFFEITENISVEATYDDPHVIQIKNFGNATHDSIGVGAYSTSSNGSYVGVRCWDPYGISNKRNAGTINYSTGTAVIYGDYANNSGIGAALLIHEDYEKHDKVVITYGDDTVEYPLDNVNGVNETWYVNDTKILNFVQVKGAEFYNVRFYNIDKDLTIESVGTVSAAQNLTLNNDGTVTQNIRYDLPEYNENYVATVDGEEVELEAMQDGRYEVKLSALAPAKLVAERNIVIKDENGENKFEATTSAKSYLMSLIEADHALKPFAISMLNFGAYCQIYYGETDGGLANSELESAAIDVSNVEANATNDRSVVGETDGIVFYGQSLNLKSTTSLNIYFQITDGSPVSVFEFKDGDTILTPKRNGGNVYFVTISNVAAPDLAVKHNFTVTKGGQGTLSVTASVLSYANVIIEKYADSSDQDKINLVNAMKAIYLYNEKAIEASEDL